MTKARTNADNASADIQGVTAGTGLSGGGTSGTVTLTNDMATTIDAKGDLVVGTGADTYSRLAVSDNGSTLVADSSQSTGLRWAANYGFTAGKNKIINGDCSINQRNFSSGTTQGQFVVDRFQDDGNGGTITSSVQQFTPGTAPVAGYEAKQFMRTVTVSQSAAGNYQAFSQAIEDVRTIAGQTVTISFWAKAASGTPNIGVSLRQDFGSGGSSAVITSAAVQAITSSWARYSFTINVPSISGKTVGSSSYTRLYIFVSVGSTIAGFGYPNVGLQNNTFDIWGVQLETGSVATAFQTATGTLAGELAACQRYYIRYTGPASYPTFASKGVSSSTTLAYFWIDHPVELRTAATSIEYATLGAYNFTPNIYALTNLVLDNCNSKVTKLAATTSGMTANHFMVLVGNNTSAAYLGINAEL